MSSSPSHPPYETERMTTWAPVPTRWTAMRAMWALLSALSLHMGLCPQGYTHTSLGGSQLLNSKALALTPFRNPWAGSMKYAGR
eukprot:7089905-Prymnesium_polylepis.1